MPTKKLVVLTYLQYILIVVGILLLFAFVRQIDGVLLIFFLASALSHALNPLIRCLKTIRMPRVLAVPGVFLGLTVAALFLVAQRLEGNILVPCIVGTTTGVHSLWVLFATLAVTALYGIVGAVFAVPIVATISSAWRYLGETLAGRTVPTHEGNQIPVTARAERPETGSG